MVLEGVINLKASNDDYIMFSSGANTNISEMLNLMLLEDVSVVIKHAYNNKVLFNKSGKLIKKRISPHYYVYYIGDANLDDILWNNVGSRIRICIQNISKC